jgi:hypothetical protein
MSSRSLAVLILFLSLGCADDPRSASTSPTEPAPAPRPALNAAAMVQAVEQSSVCRALIKAHAEAKVLADSLPNDSRLVDRADQLDAAVADVCH